MCSRAFEKHRSHDSKVLLCRRSWLHRSLAANWWFGCLKGKASTCQKGMHPSNALLVVYLILSLSLSLARSRRISLPTVCIYIYMYNSNNSHPLAHVSMLYIVLIYASCCCAGSIQHYHQTAAEGGIQHFVSLGMGQNHSKPTNYTIWVCTSVYQLFWCSPKKIKKKYKGLTHSHLLMKEHVRKIFGIPKVKLYWTWLAATYTKLCKPTVVVCSWLDLWDLKPLGYWEGQMLILPRIGCRTSWWVLLLPSF